MYEDNLYLLSHKFLIAGLLSPLFALLQSVHPAHNIHYISSAEKYIYQRAGDNRTWTFSKYILKKGNMFVFC